LSLLATGQWFSLETPVSSTNKTDCHDITEILLKMALNTISQTVKCDDDFTSKYIIITMSTINFLEATTSGTKF